jgi:hypothetical protein
MSPELKRNLWLEFTGSRVIIMTSVLGLVAIAIYLVSGRHFAPLGPIGVAGYVFITIFWGSRNAARSVIGEIRERTWDFQRLSAVTPVSMTVGKLFGATSYTWYGGLLSLLIAAPGLARMMDPAEVTATLALLVATGLLAHAVALGSALATARRRRADARLSVLPHQAAGLAAAIAPTWFIGSFGRRWFDFENIREITWFDVTYSSLEFTTVATFVFAAWAIVGCWREMRLELMQTNAPLVWPTFLGFLAIFLWGFGPNGGAGLALAYVGVHAAAMISLIVEPKNNVELRALGAAAMEGRIGRVLVGLPAYGWAFLGAAALAVALAFAAPVRTLGFETVSTTTAFAALGFLARDIGVFHFFHAKPRQMRGDFAGLVALAIAYVLGGAIASAVDSETFTAFVAPTFEAPAWTFVLPWMQAAAVWFFAVARFRGARPAGAAVPAEASSSVSPPPLGGGGRGWGSARLDRPSHDDRRRRFWRRTSRSPRPPTPAPPPQGGRGRFSAPFASTNRAVQRSAASSSTLAAARGASSPRTAVTRAPRSTSRALRRGAASSASNAASTTSPWSASARTCSTGPKRSTRRSAT